MTPRPPFIVGAPRSGTTLLRLMLDAHSQLAIPPETGFVPAVASLGRDGGRAERTAFWRILTGSETWPDFGLDPGELLQRLPEADRFDAAAGLRIFYRLYASRFGKPGWGDKTPSYAFQIPVIRALIPESCFIHVVRDGRDVALSLSEVWFSPGDAVEERARTWRRSVEAARSHAELEGYLEVRYEDLVLQPERVLERVCAALGTAFEAAMLQYHRRAAKRLEEHQARHGPDGEVWLSKQERLSQQRRTQLPPDSSRVYRWRRHMPREETRRFEAVAGDTLRELGYEVSA